MLVLHPERIGLPSQLVRGVVLLALAAAPQDGSELCKRLDALGFFDVTLGSVNRVLLNLEAERLVHSSPAAKEKGSLRRVYELTPAGWSLRKLCTRGIEDLRSALDEVLSWDPRRPRA